MVGSKSHPRGGGSSGKPAVVGCKVRMFVSFFLFTRDRQGYERPRLPGCTPGSRFASWPGSHPGHNAISSESHPRRRDDPVSPAGEVCYRSRIATNGKADRGGLTARPNSKSSSLIGAAGAGSDALCNNRKQCREILMRHSGGLRVVGSSKQGVAVPTRVRLQVQLPVTCPLTPFDDVVRPLTASCRSRRSEDRADRRVGDSSDGSCCPRRHVRRRRGRGDGLDTRGAAPAV